MKKHFFFLLLLPLTLTACGGGGGGGGSTPPIPPPPIVNKPDPPAPTIKEPTADQLTTIRDNTEYQVQSGLALINADWIYGRLLANNLGSPGKDIILGIVDNGFNHHNSEISDAVEDASSLAYGGITTAPASDSIVDLTGGDKAIPNYCTTNELCYGKRSDTEWARIPTTSEVKHGTDVASLMIGKKDGKDYHGLAYAGKILAYAKNIDDDNNESFRPNSHIPTVKAEDFSDPSAWDAEEKDYADGFTFMADNTILAFNLSLSLEGAISLYLDEHNTDGRTPAEAKAALADIFTARKQTSKQAADKTIMVVAAGNDRSQTNPAASPLFFAGLPLLDSELAGHHLAVVSVAATGTIASYSNLCGIAKAFCLAAQGEARRNEANRNGNGTSLAAPFVTAAIGLLAQYFPNMGNGELVTRLLMTANKTGIYADSDIYGQGLLDLKAATEPAGETQMPTGSGINEGGIAELGSLFQTSDAMGDAIAQAFRQKKILTLDSLGAPFPRKLSDYHRPQSQTRLQTALHTLGTMRTLKTEDKEMRYRNMQGLGLFSTQATPHAIDTSKMIAPYLSLAANGVAIKYRHNNIQIAAFHGSAKRNETTSLYYENPPSSGIMLGFQSGNHIGFQLGAIEEREGALGTIGRGAFYLGSRTMTYFSGLEMARPLPNGWQGFLNAYGGITHIRQGTGASLLSAIKPILSSSFALGLARNSLWKQGDSFTLQLSQPLRIESGEMKIRYPTQRTRYKQVLHQETNIPLTPSAREFEMSINYALPLTTTRNLATSFTAIKNPHHSNHYQEEIRILFHLYQAF